MKYLRLLLNYCLVIGIWLLVIVPTAHAQVTGLSIDPPTLEVLLSPNKKVIHAFNIVNQGSSSQFVANIYPIKPTDEYGHVEIGSEPLNLSEVPIIVTLENANIKFGQPFFLEAGASSQIVLGIEGASIGESEDTYFALVISSESGKITASNGATAQAGISSLVFVTLTPSGAFPVDIELSDFEPPLIMDNASTLDLTPKITNKSSIMLRVQGTLSILSPRGNHNEDITLYPTLVLRDSSRRLLASSPSDPPQPSTLMLKPSISNIGPYRLRLTIETVGGTTIQETERTIWLLPIKAIFITIVLIILTFLYLTKKNSK